MAITLGELDSFTIDTRPIDSSDMPDGNYGTYDGPFAIITQEVVSRGINKYLAIVTQEVTSLSRSNGDGNIIVTQEVIHRGLNIPFATIRQRVVDD